MSDLNVFDALHEDKPIPVPLKDPVGHPHKGNDGKPIIFDLLPPNCPKAKARIAAVVERKRTLAASEETLTREQVEAFDHAVIAAYIDGWSRNWELDKTQMVYTEDNAIRLVGRVAPVKQMLVNWGTHQGNAWAALQSARLNGRAGEAD